MGNSTVWGLFLRWKVDNSLSENCKAGDGGPRLAVKPGACVRGGEVASLGDVSLLLAQHCIKITERHYLRFDQRRQERLTRAAMVDLRAGGGAEIAQPADRHIREHWPTSED